MAESPSYTQLARLPKWARDYIRAIERERNVAVKTLTEWEDGQTPSRFFVEEHVSDGAAGTGPSMRVRYIRASMVRYVGAGVDATFIERQDGLDILFGPESRTGPGETAALFPKSGNAVSIKAVTEDYLLGRR